VLVGKGGNVIADGVRIGTRLRIMRVT
jgi:hypothetical protein